MRMVFSELFTIPFPGYDLIQHIIGLCFYALSFIISSTVFIIECRTRIQISKDNNLKQSNSTIINKSLNIHS